MRRDPALAGPQIGGVSQVTGILYFLQRSATSAAERSSIATEYASLQSRPVCFTDLHADLVFEGGGVKGIGLAGALATLEERGYRPQNVAGTSAGSISAALLAAGYSAAELREIIMRSTTASSRTRAGRTRCR